MFSEGGGGCYLGYKSNVVQHFRGSCFRSHGEHECPGSCAEAINCVPLIFRWSFIGSTVPLFLSVGVLSATCFYFECMVSGFLEFLKVSIGCCRCPVYKNLYKLYSTLLSTFPSNCTMRLRLNWPRN